MGEYYKGYSEDTKSFRQWLKYMRIFWPLQREWLRVRGQGSVNTRKGCNAVRQSLYSLGITITGWPADPER